MAQSQTDSTRPAIQWQRLETTLGPAVVAASDRGICHLSFGDTPDLLLNRHPDATLWDQAGRGSGACSEWFVQAARCIEDPVAVDEGGIPLDPVGTDFQRRVWAMLRQIPAGETRTYGDLAKGMGSPGSSRAVGGANGANRIAVLIPCHRVIAADGGLGGYAYGKEIKAELLRREGWHAAMPSLPL